MTDDIWKRDEIESPCVKICVIHRDTGLCTGCLRTRDEIAVWSGLTTDQRRAIMSDLQNRAGELARRRGGRKARLNRRA